MPYTGRLENRPLLDVIQIVAYSQQSGILSVKGITTKGLLIFEDGNIVCAYSPAALPLLVKAAKEADEQHRLTFRRIQILAALRELFDLAEGDYRFVKKNDPVTELEGLDIKPKPTAADRERADQRKHERYGPVIIKGRLLTRDQTYDGFLTNLSGGGTFFHSESLPSSSSLAELEFDLPWELGACRVSCNVAWLRAEGPDAKRGAGLSFREFEGDSRERISSYIARFQELAADVNFQA
jgi:hypothetical protein